MQHITLEAAEAGADKTKDLPTDEISDVQFFRNGLLVKIWHGLTIEESTKNICSVKTGTAADAGVTVVCQTIESVIGEIKNPKLDYESKWATLAFAVK